MVELGVSVIAAKSFARIHRANLIAQGILPLEIPYNVAATLGEHWHIGALARAIQSGKSEIAVHREGESFTASINLSARERELLLHGGALNLFRIRRAQ
jgi:aconitate hydratase